MANLAGVLGVDVGEVTLHDVLATGGDPGGTDSSAPDPAAAIHEEPHGLSVVPGSPALDAFSRTNPERLDGVLADLAADHDYVVLDTGAGLSPDTVAPLTFVDEVLLVSTPTRNALGEPTRPGGWPSASAPPSRVPRSSGPTPLLRSPTRSSGPLVPASSGPSRTPRRSGGPRTPASRSRRSRRRVGPLRRSPRLRRRSPAKRRCADGGRHGRRE